jgi:hypothetical protein
MVMVKDKIHAERIAQLLRKANEQGGCAGLTRVLLRLTRDGRNKLFRAMMAEFSF